jgi:RHH-type proline utilization regulon transcriptional repressor/proline dehydrogenase/delta 1-pyrroline-5-carboxylate dehydrogenase
MDVTPAEAAVVSELPSHRRFIMEASGNSGGHAMTIPDTIRATLQSHCHEDEAAAGRRLRGLVGLSDEARRVAVALARRLVGGARTRTRAGEHSYFDSFMQEFGLSNPEGVALMCLAEALLRVPDEDTADRLIAETLAAGDWAAHRGGSDSLFVNASTWGLMLSGRVVELDPAMRADAGGWLRGLRRRVGEPVVRAAMRRAMAILGGEFVVGRTIDEALERSEREPGLGCCSFDMLGEGARTQADARRHLAAYAAAIDAIGARRGAGDLHATHAISIKLSALEPRYSPLQPEQVRRRLIPGALQLARRAASFDLGLTIDAEEADRLDLSLEVVAALAADPQTRGWDGLGVAVQAYGKRAPDLLDWIAATARTAGRRMTVRLVKGAYWDSEIKRAQERGLDGYPVYTRKLTTDVAYLACATRLFAATDVLYPQFATHNAHTIAAVLQLRPAGAACEFQRLHGMGRLVYDEARREVADLPRVRVYAPVGAYEDLLAYLVRRLLENGANSSFVNRLMDAEVPVEELVRDPLDEFDALLGAGAGAALAHPRIPLPIDLLRSAPDDDRPNSRGIDFGNPPEVEALLASVRTARRLSVEAGPLLDGRACGGGATTPVRNPADLDEVVGVTRDATAAEIAGAFDLAAAAWPRWARTATHQRAACLERAADLFESRRATFLDLLVREAGKTLPDALGELRETADLCRYYAGRARAQFAAPQRLPGPTGERNELSLHGRGVFACISPWNFPLAIFVGQVAAALVAGNAVVAKPAAPATLVGAAAIRLLHEAGVPAGALQLVPAAGRAFGDVAFRHPALAGVALTGSTATAQAINRALAARDGPIVPLIAETGGLNAMVVDSTALPEQVVDDALASAFNAAGQRCSALRLLFVQEDVAGRVLGLLRGAMDELVIGDPSQLSTDVGPVISAAAREGLLVHLARMRAEARRVESRALDARHARGHFVAPALVELADFRQLRHEAFGPILHVARFAADQLPEVLAAIRDSGYGLTLGVQTRLASTWQAVFDGTGVGNTYVNRNMIGAVVGMQPFGGNGLSGTGPKAGGPHYLLRFANERTLTVNETATGGNVELLRALGN